MMSAEKLDDYFNAGCRTLMTLLGYGIVILLTPFWLPIIALGWLGRKAKLV